MKMSAIAASFRTQMNSNYATTAVSYLNRKFKNSEHEQWVNLRWRAAGSPYSDEKGDNPAIIRNGTLIADVFVPELAGEDVALQIADEIESIFTFYEDGELYVKPPDIDPKGVNSRKKYRVTVTFPWEILYCMA